MAVNVSNININQENIQNSAIVKEAEIDGIEILVNMAQQGKIDPWNIDIVDITDKYLTHLFKSKAQNLRLTGRTLLFAAILLKLKSNVLEGIDILNFDSDTQDDLEYGDDEMLDYSEEYIPSSNVISIDEVLQRRTSVRLNHNRVVTLRDLIRQLEFYEMLDDAYNHIAGFKKISIDDTSLSPAYLCATRYLVLKLMQEYNIGKL